MVTSRLRSHLGHKSYQKMFLCKYQTAWGSRKKSTILMSARASNSVTNDPDDTMQLNSFPRVDSWCLGLHSTHFLM